MIRLTIPSAILLCASFAWVQGTTVSPCSLVEAPLPSEAEVLDCPETPCTVIRNQTITTTMRFTSPRYLENIAPHAVATALGVTVTYPLDQTDACEGITNTQCPLAEGELVEYTYGIFITSVIPLIDLTLEFSLLDMDENETIECFKVGLHVVDP